MSDKEAVRSYYDHGGAKNSEAIATILQTLAAKKNLGRTLDVGCGNGAVLEALGRYTSHAVGADASAHAVALASQRLPALQIVRADVQESLPFPADSFDTVLLLDVIEHLRAPAYALGEVHRVLNHGGILAVTTPNANSPLRYLRGNNWFGVSDPGHISFFTAFTLTHLLRATGFHLEMIRLELFTGTWLDALLRPARIGGTLFVAASKGQPRR